jgi:hypothetical protein
VTPDFRDQQLRIAFAAVFGLDGSRTKEQQIVWAFLSRFCRENASTFEGLEVERMVFLEGRREVLLEIRKRLTTPQPTVDELLGVENEDRSDE